MCTLAGMLRRVTVSAVSHVNVVFGAARRECFIYVSGLTNVSQAENRVAERDMKREPPHCAIRIVN